MSKNLTLFTGHFLSHRFYSNPTIPSCTTKRTRNPRIMAQMSGGLSTGLLAVLIITLACLYTPSGAALAQQQRANVVSEAVIKGRIVNTNDHMAQILVIMNSSAWTKALAYRFSKNALLQTRFRWVLSLRRF